MACAKTSQIRVLAVDSNEDILKQYENALGQGMPTDVSPPMQTGATAIPSEGEASQVRFDVTLCRDADSAIKTVRMAIEEEKPFAVAFLNDSIACGGNGVSVADQISSHDSELECAVVMTGADKSHADIFNRISPTDRLVYLKSPLHSVEIRQTAHTLGSKWQLQKTLRETEEDLVIRHGQEGTDIGRLVNILESTSDFVSTAHPDGQLLYMNKAGRKLAGLNESEDIGKYQIKDFYSAIPYDCIAKIGIPSAIENGVWEGDMKLLRRDGREIAVSQVIMAHKSESGDLEYLSTIMRDLTDREHVEQELRKHRNHLEELVEERTEEIKHTELKYRTLFDNTAMPITCWVFKDSEWRIEVVNNVAARYLGGKPEEFVGKSLHEIVDQDFADTMVQRFQSIIDSGAGEHFEDRLTLKTGTYWFKTEVYPSKDLEGRVIAMQVVSEDFTERIGARQALEESEARYRTLVENAFMGIYVRRGYEFLYINQRAIEISGYSEEELKQMSGLDLIHPDDRARVAEMVGMHDPGTDPRPMFKYRVVTKDGDARWIESFGIRVDYDGELAILTYFIDVTEQKKTQQALEESEARYRTLVESAFMGIYVRHQGDKFSFVNRRMSEIAGYSKEELTKMSGLELIHPDDRVRVAKQMTEHDSGRDLAKTFQYRIITKDGDVRWIESYGSHIEYKGQPAMLGCLLDITERMKAEMALKESEELFRSLVGNSRVSIYVVQDGKVKYVDRQLEELSGYSSEEIKRMSLLDLVHPDDREFATKQLQKRMSGKSDTAFNEYRGITKKGETIWLEASGALISYQGRTAVLGNFIDITDRKKAEEALRKSEERFRSLVENSRVIIYVIQD